MDQAGRLQSAPRAKYADMQPGTRWSCPLIAFTEAHPQYDGSLAVLPVDVHELLDRSV